MTSVDETFDKLRRESIEQAYIKISRHMREVCQRQGINSIGYNHPDVEPFIVEQNYTVKEIVDYHDKIYWF